MRRRRTKYTWLPILGTGLPQDPDNTSSRIFQLIAPSDGTTAIAFANITFDNPLDSESANTADPLVTLVGSEYLLTRIVGKAHASIFSNVLGPGGNTVDADFITPAIQVCLAFFIARQEDGQTLDRPVGGLLAAPAIELYGPADADNQREPWIWRRTWILGNPLRRQPPTFAEGEFNDASVKGITGEANFPATNAEYGSVLDGPHIDSKVKRRVSQENRLYAVVTVRNYPLGLDVGTPPEGSAVTRGDLTLDVRLLGALRKAKNKSAF